MKGSIRRYMGLGIIAGWPDADSAACFFALLADLPHIPIRSLSAGFQRFSCAAPLRVSDRV